jgi:hypothetical protein
MCIPLSLTVGGTGLGPVPHKNCLDERLPWPRGIDGIGRLFGSDIKLPA